MEFFAFGIGIGDDAVNGLEIHQSQQLDEGGVESCSDSAMMRIFIDIDGKLGAPVICRAGTIAVCVGVADDFLVDLADYVGKIRQGVLDSGFKLGN